MSISVVDLQNEAVNEEAPIPEPIEEVNEEVDNTVVDTANETIEETNEQPKEEVKEEVKEKPKRQTQKDKINCGKCGKEMTIKSYRYSHEKNCKGQLQDRAVKPHAKPRAKQAPKPVPVPVYEDEEDQPTLSAPVKKQVFKAQPSNPLPTLQQHYQLLQNEYIKQKQEKYNNLCQNMFKPKTKKR